MQIRMFVNRTLICKTDLQTRTFSRIRFRIRIWKKIITDPALQIRNEFEVRLLWIRLPTFMRIHFRLFTLMSLRIRIRLYTLTRILIRMRLPEMMRTRIRNTAQKSNFVILGSFILSVSPTSERSGALLEIWFPSPYLNWYSRFVCFLSF